MGLAPPNLWHSKALHPAVHCRAFIRLGIALQRRRRDSREEIPCFSHGRWLETEPDNGHDLAFVHPRLGKSRRTLEL
jgi:hypothetical protein